MGLRKDEHFFSSSNNVEVFYNFLFFRKIRTFRCCSYYKFDLFIITPVRFSNRYVQYEAESQSNIDLNKSVNSSAKLLITRYSSREHVWCIKNPQRHMHYNTSIFCMPHYYEITVIEQSLVPQYSTIFHSLWWTWNRNRSIEIM